MNSSSGSLDLNQPEFLQQEEYLKKIPKEKWKQLILLIDDLDRNKGNEHGSTEKICLLNSMVYDFKLIFNFNWMNWEEGINNLKDPNFDFTKLSPLEASLYLTIIFRSDRFSDGAINHYLNNGTLGKIFNHVWQNLLK